MTSETGIGAAVKRKEDARFITGAGHYTDDINQPGQLYAVFVRSMYPRAEIRSIDVSSALAMEGVVAAYTGADLAADEIGDLPCGWMVKSKDGSDMIQPPHPPIAVSLVNYVGEPYAMVVAETLQAARDGAEAVTADFDELPAVVDLASAHGADQIHETAPGNQCYDWELGDRQQSPNSQCHGTTCSGGYVRGGYGELHAIHHVAKPPSGASSSRRFR